MKHFTNQERTDMESAVKRRQGGFCRANPPNEKGAKAGRPGAQMMLWKNDSPKYSARLKGLGRSS